MQSAEDFADAALATLIRDLEGQLAAQEARYAGGPHDIGALQRPRYAPAPDGDFYPGGAGTVVRYPTIELAMTDLRGERFSIDQHDSDAFPRVVVRAWLASAKFDVLYRTTTRYGAAIHDALMAVDPATHTGSGFGAAVGVRSYRAMYRWNPEANERDEVQSFVLIVYELDADDLRP